MKALTIALAGLTIAVGLSVPAAAEAPKIRWTSCKLNAHDELGTALDKGGAQCARIKVPLDYANPSGRKITLAVARIKAREKRIGTLMINTGGPAGAAMADTLFVGEAMKGLGRRFDLVGMDPRFVGRSTPLDCGWPTGTWFRSAGVNRASFDRQVAFQRSLAARCLTKKSDVLPYVSTRNTARDMDRVRTLLGQKKISYLGYSYGTYLGAVYSQMFPGRLDRVVLDSALDPRRYNPRLLRGAERENDAALRGWAAWTAKRHRTYGLGRTADKVLATLTRITETAARKPIRIGRGALDDTMVPVIAIIGIQDDRPPVRAELANQMSLVNKAAAGRKVKPSEGLRETIATLTTGADSPYGSAQSAILCGDVAAPAGPETYWADIQRLRAKHPLTAPMTNNIGPCAFWPAPRETPTEVTGDVPALIVNSTGDTRTTYKGARALHALWPSSRLVTVKGSVHAVFGNYGNTCADTIVNAYFRSGRLPGENPPC